MSGTMISLPDRIRPVDFDRPQKQFNMAQKTYVKPDMATYSFNSMLCKFLITNYEWHNDLTTRSNSTGRFQLASKTV